MPTSNAGSPRERRALGRRCPKCNAAPHHSCVSTMPGQARRFLKHVHDERMKEEN